MTLDDLIVLIPVMAVAVLAGVVLLLDLATRQKDLLPLVAAVGLAVPLGAIVGQWLDLGTAGKLEIPSTSVIADAFRVDRFSLFFQFLFVSVAALVVLASTDYVKKFERFQGEYYALVLFSTSGMMLLASATELITLYIALELTTLPIAALAAFIRNSRSTESAMKFLILGAISSAVLLYGIVIVYGFTGTTSLADIALTLGNVQLEGATPFGSYALLFGLVLMIAGFGFKIASVPFHMWAPDVYEGSPTPITAFLSVASKAAGFAVILRVFYEAFSLEVLSIEWSAIFAVLSVLSMSIGNLVAIRQSNIKRMLGYSTVAHAGYLMVGLAAVSVRSPGAEALGGPSGVLFYLGGYAATNLAAFCAVIAISNRTGSDQIEDFAGMSQRAPYMAAVLALAMISLIGVPPTVGFWAKIYIFGAAVDANLEWLVLAGVVNSVVSAYYYVRVIKVMYLSPPATNEPVRSPAPMRLAILGTFAGTLFLGIYPTPLLQLARSAAEALLT